MSTSIHNKMGTQPVGKLVLTMSLPMMISMIIQALYNIVDSLFISRIAEIGDSAITAITLAFPVQMLIIAVCIGTGIGVKSTLAMALGERDQKRANKIANNSIFLALITYIIFLIFGIFAIGIFFKTQTNDNMAYKLGVQYLTICTVFSFGLIFQLAFESILQSTGNTSYTMITQGIGAIINIILDPILIFGLFGAPAMGIEGAAYATVIGQIIAFTLALFFCLTANKGVHLKIKGFRPDKKEIKQIYKIGAPAIVMQSLTSVMTYGMNIILGGISQYAVMAYGIYYRLQNFIFMPIYGLNGGVLPIIAFNYGAKNKERILRASTWGMGYALFIMAIGILIFQLFPNQLFDMFKSSDELLKIGTVALVIISTSYIFAGFNIMAQSVFQALQNGIYSLIISFLRIVVVILPVAYLLASSENAEYIVWWAIPIAECFAAIVSLFLLKVIYEQKLKCLVVEN